MFWFGVKSRLYSKGVGTQRLSHANILTPRLFAEWTNVQLPFCDSEPCDQIWRNLAALAERFKSLVIFMAVYLVFGIFFKLTLAKWSCHWAKFNCCNWPIVLKIIYPSGHTVCSKTDPSNYGFAAQSIDDRVFSTSFEISIYHSRLL